MGAGPAAVGPIYDGPELDYQPSIIRVQPSGQLMVVFERFGSPPYGDFFASFSGDNGKTWLAPQEILPSPLYERHPSLVQLGPDDFALFYLVDETGGGGYRIHWATSSGGLDWTAQGRVDLGWVTSGEINPTVIREADGTLTMTYHRLSGPSYIARSIDDGVTWDKLQTQVSNGSAPLPRLAKRESDGLYVVSYQVNMGGNQMGIYVKTSTDPYDWSGPQVPISTAVDSHDSQPIVLEDGTLLVVYGSRPVHYYDLFYRTSCDGLDWSEPVQVTNNPSRYDTQPHPLLHGSLGHLILVWSHQDDDNPTPYQDHDVWANNDLVIPPDLSDSTKLVEPDFFEAGDSLSYTLRLANQGDGPTVGHLTDPIPTGGVYQPGSLWASSGDYAYDPVAEVITWTGVMSVSAQVSLTFQPSTSLSWGDGDVLTNTAWLSDDQGGLYTLLAIATVDALPPTSAVLDPLDGQLISATSYLINGVASDTVSGISRVEVSPDGAPWQLAQGQEAWTFLWDGLSDGEHNLRSRATDGVGQIEMPTPGITITGDTPPAPPEIASFSPPDGANDVALEAAVVITFSETIDTNTFSYTVAPNPGGWAVTWGRGGAAMLPAESVVTLTHAPFALGMAYTFTVTAAQDLEGNPLLGAPVRWSFATPAYYRIYLGLVQE